MSCSYRPQPQKDQSKREICTRYKLLTSADVVLQKRLKLEKKLSKSAKSKPKKLKS
ncbi:hypothetical protein DPMN_015485 [Dreissena polymorpha]|uniref:Uncharacterized protein n=1 Tax=Dreissena polymorpha TaxID=45954 RepID=A0A9D4NBM7_DREPO|nr:hypothetical protein DPMN_015485 [Dreissena polymorpha]